MVTQTQTQTQTHPHDCNRFQPDRESEARQGLTKFFLENRPAPSEFGRGRRPEWGQRLDCDTCKTGGGGVGYGPPAWIMSG